MNTRHFGSLFRAAFSAVFVMALAVPLQAQDASSDNEELEEITVTGSRIARRDFISPSPIVTADIRAMDQFGYDAVENFLRQMPQFRPGFGEFSNTSSGGTIGQATLDLRGLGPQRNLVLLEGRRLQSSSGNGAIDLNTIPTLAIGAAEVITGGASATYGSDAIAGVVNFKLRQDLDGFEVLAQYAMPEENDGEAVKLGLAYGTDYSDGRGSLLLSGEYFDRNGVAFLDREFFQDPLPSSFIPYVRSTPGMRADSTVVNGILAGHGAGPAPSSFYGLNNDGTLFASGAGAESNYRGATDDPYISNSDGTFGYHGQYYNYLRSPLERYSFFGNTEFDFSDRFTGYAQLLYSNSDAQNIGSEPILAGVWGMFVPVTHPDWATNADWQAVLASRAGNPAAPVEVHYRAADAGPRTYNTENDLWQVLFGAKGDNDAGTLNWDIHASFSKSENTDNTSAGAVSASAFQSLVDAADGGASICTGGFSIVGSVPLSPDCLAYVSRTPSNTTTLEQTVIEGVLEGRMFDMPAGEARFALVGGYRENTYKFDPDADIAANDLASLTASQPTDGSVDVVELAGEAFLPLAEGFNATLGYRYSDYNLAGGANTYKAELDWTINETFLVRGGYQHASRAPNVDEYFNAGTQGVVQIGVPPSAGDPCDVRHPSLSDPNVQQLCIDTGMDPAAVGRHRMPTGSTVGTVLGNRDLDPESADTITAGVVVDIPFQSDMDMRFSVDYYDIDIEDAIFVIDAMTTLAKCYNVDGSNPTYDASNFFCQSVDRSASGLFNSINQQYLNLGGLRTSGIDIAFDWAIPLGNGDKSLHVASYANNMLDYEVAALEGDPYTDRSGTISGDLSYPEWKFLTSLTFESGLFSTTARWRRISSMDDLSTVTNSASTVPGTDAYNYLDLSATFTIQERTQLSIGINNATNEDPPIVGGTPASTNPGVYDPIGRSFYVSARMEF